MIYSGLWRMFIANKQIFFPCFLLFLYLCSPIHIRKQMFSNIVNRLIALIFKPTEAWARLKQKEEDHETFLSRYLYPLIGCIALAAFLGVLFSRKEFNFEIALKSAIKMLLSSGGGFFMAVYMLNELWNVVFKRSKDLKLWQYFVGYASSLMFVLSIVVALLPEFYFLRILVLWTVYIIWEGAVGYMEVMENEQLKFTLIASGIIIGMPLVIDFLLFLLMPGLRL